MTTETSMMRKLIISFGLAALLATAGAVSMPTDASAGWRGGHGGKHVRHFHHRPAHVVHPRFHHRPFVRRHVVRHAFIGAPIAAYGPECVVKRRVRWTPYGPVRVAKRVCY